MMRLIMIYLDFYYYQDRHECFHVILFMFCLYVIYIGICFVVNITDHIQATFNSIICMSNVKCKDSIFLTYKTDIYAQKMINILKVLLYNNAIHAQYLRFEYKQREYQYN